MVEGSGSGSGSGDTDARVGTVVAGVRLSALVGRGATGEVWAGTEVTDGSRVAVKLVRDGSADVEAVLLGGLRHPHVLGVRRVWHDPPAVVTDLAGGGSVAAQVRARGCLRPAEVVTVVAPLADALAWLHGRGVVHGDVSATNVLFVERGRAVLSDLGAARLAGEGTIVATPGFAAPEVVGGAAPGPAADVHGLGAIGWLALTGMVPPAPEDRLPLRLLVPECPDALVAAVTLAMDPDPSRRPTPLELAAQVRSACPGEAVRLVPAAALGVRADEAVTYRVREAAAWDRDGRRPVRHRLRGLPLPSPRGRTRLAVAGVLGAALVAVAATAWPLVQGRAWQGAELGRSSDVVADSASQPAARADEPVTVPAPGSGTESVTGPTDDTGAAQEAGSGLRGAVGEGLAPVVVELVRARGEALQAGDPEALSLVHHPDGATLALDRELLAAGPVEVSYQVLSVRPVGDQVAAVDLVTTAVGADPVREVVLVEVARVDGRWLVLAVSR